MLELETEQGAHGGRVASRQLRGEPARSLSHHVPVPKPEPVTGLSSGLVELPSRGKCHLAVTGSKT